MAVKGGAAMTTIKATVRGGRLEVDGPIGLPDGTELLIPIPNGADTDPNRQTSPQEIAQVLAAMDRMEPLAMTSEELAAWEADRQARRESDKATSAAYAERLRRMWE
jgi:hypothetical protein